MIEAFLLKAGLIVLAIIAAYILYMLLRAGIKLAVHAVVGILALLIFNYVFNAEIAINLYSILITAVGGIIGFFTVLAVHYTGIAF